MFKVHTCAQVGPLLRGNLLTEILANSPAHDRILRRALVLMGQCGERFGPFAGMKKNGRSAQLHPPGHGIGNPFALQFIAQLQGADSIPGQHACLGRGQ